MWRDRGAARNSLSETTAPSSPTSPAAASTVDRGEIGLAHGASAYYECRGEGGPPILFEAGTDIGGTEGSYDSLLGRLAEATAVCTCDRLGTGSSDPAPHRWRIMVDSCAVQDQVIAELRLTPPYVRAGQSGGGNLSIGFAARAGPVAAVVTIDSYHDDPQGLRAEGFDWRDNVEYVD
jgi:pimeloyl-ACP methyl ester carboxylesterase